tara:strand:+ start:5117 stop:5839 length:723 start_codon:yes stop_codon:yes gene_type:complete
MMIHVEQNVDLDENDLGIIEEFFRFCCERLELPETVSVHLVANRDGLTTAGAYHVGESKCRVLVGDRARADVMRSMAHEMVHAQQDGLGLLGGHVQDIGGDIEDEANAVAGRLVKEFSYDYGVDKVYEGLDPSRIDFRQLTRGFLVGESQPDCQIVNEVSGKVDPNNPFGNVDIDYQIRRMIGELISMNGLTNRSMINVLRSLQFLSDSTHRSCDELLQQMLDVLNQEMTSRPHPQEIEV